ncbi:MAG: tRNA pseudouridine(55) synthase TruB [Clostridia bacterium]|nr:tRNA pseudouridine(55) synthase TruB [Clostridia bacterium]
MNDLSLTASLPEPDGILLVDKPAGMTSHDVVYKVRKLYGTRKVGHTGTLDPLATGVLVVLLGRAAKASEYVSHDEKSYEAVLRLGLTTDTEDTTGRILSVVPSGRLPDDAAVEAVLPRFRGVILQVPPMYSALKVDGRKLCDIARQGGTVEREARPVEIRRLVRAPGRLPSDHILSVTCSGGTYIRTLCADIGNALGVGGVMASLRRTAAGGFGISQCVTLEELNDMDPVGRLGRLLPTEALFSDLPRLKLSPFYSGLCRNGCELYQKKLGTGLPLGQRVRLADDQGRFFALGEVMDFDGQTAVKMIKLFSL